MVGRMHLRIRLVLFAISCQCNFGMLRMIPKPKTTGTRRQRNRIESSRQSQEERSMKGSYLWMVSRTKRRYTDYKVLQPMMTHLIRFLALSNTYEVLRSRTTFWTLCSWLLSHHFISTLICKICQHDRDIAFCCLNVRTLIIAIKSRNFSLTHTIAIFYHGVVQMTPVY